MLLKVYRREVIAGVLLLTLLSVPLRSSLRDGSTMPGYVRVMALCLQRSDRACLQRFDGVEDLDDGTLRYALLGGPLSLSPLSLKRLSPALTEAGIRFFQEGDWVLALESFQASLQIDRATGDLPGTATGLGNMARVLERVGNLSKAEEAYREAWELRGRLRDSRGQALMLNGLGKLALQSRRYGDARTLLHQSLEISQRERFQDTATMALITLERVEERGNRPWEALAVMKRLRRIEAEAGKGEWRNREFEILFRRERVLGLIAEQRRELEKSEEWLEMKQERLFCLFSLSALLTLLVILLLKLLCHKRETTRLTEELSRRDPLTGLSNRFGMLERIEFERVRLRRKKVPFSLLLMNFDGFNSLNERFGFEEGDRVLREVAKALRENLREEDRVGRLEGNTFLAVLPETAAEGANEAGEKVRRHVENLAFFSRDEGYGVKLSLGIVAVEDSTLCAEELIETVDRVLCRGREKGKS